jgi:hypothetical protein
VRYLMQFFLRAMGGKFFTPPRKEDAPMTRKLLAGMMVLGLSGSVLAANREANGSAPPACKVQGVWERVATISAGKRTDFTTARQAKIVTRNRFMWLEAANHRDTIPLRATVDSLRYSAMAGGYGTYDVSGHKYTEHINLFVEPKTEGKSFTASCRVEGNQWFHTYRASDIDATMPGRNPNDSTTEIWRRVE